MVSTRAVAEATACAAGFGQELGDQGADGAVEGGREQQPLAVGRGEGQQLANHGQEAEVGHVVGLVDDADLDRIEEAGAALEQVDQPAGRADENVHTAFQRGDLLADRQAAGDQAHGQTAGLTERGKRFGDLHGQLAGGHEDQTARTARRAACTLGRGLEPTEHGQSEGQGLAGAGGRATEYVAPGQDVGDDRGLDRERAG